MELNEILINWNLSKKTVEKIHASAWQVGDSYVLKTGSNIEQLKNNITIIKALSEQGIPVAEVIKTIDVLDYIIEDNKYFFVSKKIEGQHITNLYTDNYKELACIVGQVIAGLHAAFQELQQEITFYDNNFCKEITGWVWKTFRDKGISLIPEDILEECTLELSSLYPKLPRQLIHRDIHLGNMLFQDKILTGYIDFDLSQIDARIFDLCYISAGFLIGNTNDEEKTTKWLGILQSIAGGYNSILPLTADEREVVPIMITAIEMLFVAYFTANNNEENAKEAAKVLMWVWENRGRIIV